VLGAIGTRVLYLGNMLAFNANATDVDAGQSLSFSLDPDAPVNATITPGGNFSWTPSGAGTFPLTVRVTDNGIPPMSDSETISVIVLPPPQFTGTARNGSNLELTWNTQPGTSYRVEYKDALDDSDWELLTTLNATGNTLSITNGLLAPPTRFFRILVQ
jgi:hypothetical protein